MAFHLSFCILQPQVPHTAIPACPYKAPGLGALAYSILLVSFPGLSSREDFNGSPGLVTVTVSSSHTCKGTHISSRIPWNIQAPHNTLSPLTSAPPPISGHSWTVLNRHHLQVHSQSMEERALSSLEPCGKSTSQVIEQRVPNMEYHVSSRESKDCLDHLKRTRPLALSVCQTRLVLWSAWEH